MSVNWNRLVKEGDETEIQRLLEVDPLNIERSDEDSRTLLSWAAGSGRAKAVQLLLDMPNIEPNSRDRHGMTPLMWATDNGHEAVVNVLLRDSRIELNYEGFNYRTALSIAATNGNEAVVGQLIAKKGIDINPKDRDGRTPFSWAAGNGHVAVVELLLTVEGVDPNSKDECGMTPLMWATDNGHEAVVDVLLRDNRIELNYRDFGGQTALSIAATNGNEAVVGRLVAKRGIDINPKDRDGRTPFSWAAGNGHVAVVELLLTVEGVNPNSEDTDGRTPFSWAAGDGHEAAVGLLLTVEGVDPNSEDGNSNTPLSLAMEGNHEAVVKLLLASEGIDPDSDDNILLLWAAKRGHRAVVKLLLGKEDIDPNSKDKDGRTSLSWAAGNGHEAVVSILLGIEYIDPDSEDGNLSRDAKRHIFSISSFLDYANPNIRDKNGWTPLWWAVKCQKEEVVKLLVHKDSVTLHMLVKDRNLVLVQSLLQAGYDVNICDNSGITPLRLAIQQRDQILIRELLKYKAQTKGVMAEEWRSIYQGEPIIVQLSEGSDGVEHVCFSAVDELLHIPTETEKCLFILEDDSRWPRVPITDSIRPQPNKLQISYQEKPDGHDADISVCFWFLPGFNNPYGARYRIAWKIERPTALNKDEWRPIVYFSTLPYGWIPSDGIDFFMQFINHMKGKWDELCDQAEEHQIESRSDQLKSKGKTPDFMDRLAEDAQKWAMLRNILKDQICEARGFVTYYCQRYNANQTPGDLKTLLDEFDASISNRISQLDQTVRDLLQIEFAWASINETRISTKLGQNVMLLTYVSIFYLPLAFCAALWAIPDITEAGIRNAFIITSTIVGLVTLLVAFNLGSITGSVRKVYDCWRDKVVGDMRRDSRWSKIGGEFRDIGPTRRTPSEWWLLVYLVCRLARKIRASLTGVWRENREKELVLDGDYSPY